MHGREIDSGGVFSGTERSVKRERSKYRLERIPAP